MGTFVTRWGWAAALLVAALILLIEPTAVAKLASGLLVALGMALLALRAWRERDESP